MGVAVALAAISCGKDRAEPPGYGLRVVELEVAPEREGDLVAGEQLKIEVPGRARLEGREYEITIRPAGKSTLAFPKKSYEIDFQGEEFEGASEIRLAANASDISMLRAPVALDVFMSAGLPTPKWEFVAAYLNDRYLGLYFRIEKVDEDFYRHRNIPWTRLYSAEDGADFEADMPARLNRAFSGVPEPQNLQKMAELGGLVAIADDAEFQRRVFSLLSRESVVRYLAACQLTNHFDGFNKNLHYVERADTGLLEVAPWDFDLDWRYDLSPEQESSHRNRLWSRLYNLSAIKAEVTSLVRELAGQKASRARLHGRVNELKARVRDAWEADPFLGGSGKSLDDATASLHRAIEQRFSQAE